MSVYSSVSSVPKACSSIGVDEMVEDDWTDVSAVGCNCQSEDGIEAICSSLILFERAGGTSQLTGCGG